MRPNSPPCRARTARGPGLASRSPRIGLALALAAALGAAPLLAGAARGEEFEHRPDLVVEVLRIGKPRVAGQEVKVVAELRNVGTGAAAAFTLAWELDGVALAAENLAEGLAPGEVARRLLPYTSSSTGFHRFVVRVDPEGRIAESDETNNERWQVEVWMRPVGERTRPDLIVGEFDLGESRVSGRALRVAFGVGNIGRAADRDVEVVVKLDGLPEYRVAIPSLAPGEVKLMGTYLLSPTPGDHRVEVIVDPRQQFVEVDDANNSLSTSGTWRAPTREELEELKRLHQEEVDRAKRRREMLEQ